MGRMRQRQWHVWREANCVTIARHAPPRFEVAGSVMLAVAADTLCLTRLAHQVRQDLWRKLQSLRGFSPVVSVSSVPGGVAIRAGGRAARPIPQTVEETITTLLSHPPSNQRWICWSRQGKRP